MTAIERTMCPTRPSALPGIVCALAALGATIRQVPAESIGRLDPSVFTGPPAALTAPLRKDVPTPGGPLRVLTVVERMGLERRGELVRVPLFFHDGECRRPDELRLVAEGDPAGTPVAFQADDVRRDASGQVSRMHLYFEVDLAPWQRKRFLLLRGPGGGSAPPAMPLAQTADRVTLAGKDLKVTFWTDPQRGGAIAAIETAAGKVSLPHALLAPRLTLVRQDAELKTIRQTHLTWLKPQEMEVRDLRFAAGPLLAKLIVRVGPRGVPDNAEYTYLVPRHGGVLIQTQRLFPTDPNSPDVVGAADNHLLGGRLVLGDSPPDQQVVSVPAGLRRLTRSVHGEVLDALVNAKSGVSLLPVPWVQTPMGGIAAGGAEGYVSLVGTSNFKRTAGANSGTLRAFWGQVRYVFSAATTTEQLWQVARRHFQPLVAVVDEPGLAAADLRGRLAVLQEQFGSTHARDWKQEVGRLYTMGRSDELRKRWDRGGRKGEEAVEYWLDGAKAARAKLLAGRADGPKEWEKAKASGPLDPWHLTYGASPVVALSALAMPTERVDRLCLAVGRAQRQFNGRTDPTGFPYVDCFATALNMQVGSYLMGIHGGGKLGDGELARFYRDCARTPAVLGIYGHGQRPYPGLATGPVNSDLLYECNSDTWLRTIELVCNEDLWLHPSVFGRYFDCVDVNADRCHRTLTDDGKRPRSWHRASFFRGQSHDHRWESWATGPYLGMLADARDGGAVGLTEACYYTRHLIGRWINWPEITTFFLADIALREGLRRYRPPGAPSGPTDLKVARAADGNVLTWRAPPGQTAGCRVYRAAKTGGPWTWVNSPYASPPGPLVKGTRYIDPSGKADDVYFVTALDAAGRESRWFADEPSPHPGAEADR